MKKRHKPFFFFILVLIFLCKANRIFAQESYGLLITEIMADPTPSHGLPEVEYIEIYNPTDSIISLNLITLYYATFSVQLPAATILPDEYVVLVRTGNQTLFDKTLKLIVLPKLSLLNGGTTLTLKRGNEVLHSLSYSDKWYKKGFDQGYSLEMIDLNYPCVESENWTSSSDALGGTPGKENASKATNPDKQPPVFQTYDLVSDTEMVCYFNEKLASEFVENKANFAFSASILTLQSSFYQGNKKAVLLKINKLFSENKLVDLKISNATDCSGNVAEDILVNVAKLAIPKTGDIVLNEVLFNPKLGGYDFVELYNTSSETFSLKNWSLASRSKDNELSSNKIIASQNILFLPQSYLVLTIDKLVLKEFYPKTITEAVIEMESMPSLPNEEGTVVLLDNNGQIFEEFKYSATMHNPLIEEPDGVSLERIDVSKSAELPANWASASATEGFATPGYQNSQANAAEQPKSFYFDPPIFTPDGDGTDEITYLHFSLSENNALANVMLLDVEGRKIVQLLENAAVGQSGVVEWNGNDAQGRTVPMGYYIAQMQVYSANGTSRYFYDKVVVGKRN